MQINIVIIDNTFFRSYAPNVNSVLKNENFSHAMRLMTTNTYLAFI